MTLKRRSPQRRPHLRDGRRLLGLQQDGDRLVGGKLALGKAQDAKFCDQFSIVVSCICIALSALPKTFGFMAKI
ncbi:hypothetical protein MKK63_13375 [Methylobacterium sp. J-088]|uniref:hypothetical protein n=1 Tax=Methylobacterium sp. J-088 TaxID=2836664 RepID=UPI001FBAF47D|nr:hypothetical protein [Methylobacterium sp. J-088]MCJ2063694.1 hypothetical protein [Methylobacterium sp. J-088]